MNVVTRIPPSPTGHLHIGTVRTALFNYLYARKNGGKIVYRSEDTDRTRSKREFEEEILEGLKWLGITFDGEVIRQSERSARYAELLQNVIASGNAYISKEPAKDDATREVEVVRLRNPGKSITFHDEIRGDITFDTAELGDFVIARSIEDALYHFAVVVDDADMGVTHVIRGEDHISNTPRQILIQEALGFSRPAYAHLPLILAADRSKMSKRHGAVSLLEYRQEGYLPEAIINYLALLGWNPGTDQEDFSLTELVDAFDLSHVHKSGAIFDLVKFKNVNQRWMRKLSDEEFIARGALADNDPRILKAVPLMKDRATTFAEARAMLSGELACLFTTPSPDRAVLLAKEPKDTPGATKTALHGVLALVEVLPDEVSADTVKEAVMPYADEHGRGSVLWPFRYALSGAEKSPDPFSLVSILGSAESASRIKKAIAILS